MRTEKGQPGYVKARKQKYLLVAVVEFVEQNPKAHGIDGPQSL